MVSKRSLAGLGIILALSLLTGCGDADQFEPQQNNDPLADFVDDGEPDLFDDSFVTPFACVKATSSQIAIVNQGNLKKKHFFNSAHRPQVGHNGATSWSDPIRTVFQLFDALMGQAKCIN